MSAIIILRKKEHPIHHGITVRAALLALEIQPEAVIATRNGELISEEETVREGDVIKLVKIIAGG